jgi:hypothetical protein
MIVDKFRKSRSRHWGLLGEHGRRVAMQTPGIIAYHLEGPIPFRSKVAEGESDNVRTISYESSHIVPSFRGCGADTVI